MKKRTRTNSISGLAALAVFCVFAVGLLSVLLGGADVYRRLTQRDREAYDSRTCMQFVATKVRQASAPGCVVLSEFGDGPALVISEEHDGSAYWTRVYCHDGWLMELFTSAGADFAPEDGEKILEIRSLDFRLESGLLTVYITDGSGTELTQVLSLRGGEGAFS